MTLKTLDAVAWDALWNEVKKREKASETKRSVRIHRPLRTVAP
jgi:hypothetical protein